MKIRHPRPKQNVGYQKRKRQYARMQNLHYFVSRIHYRQLANISLTNTISSYVNQFYIKFVSSLQIGIGCILKNRIVCILKLLYECEMD